MTLRLAKLRAQAAERKVTMSTSPDTPEETTERAAVSEAMRRLQARSSAWRGAEVDQ